VKEFGSDMYGSSTFCSIKLERRYKEHMHFSHHNSRIVYSDCGFIASFYLYALHHECRLCQPPCIFLAVPCFFVRAAAIPFTKLQNSRWLGNSSRGTGDVEPLVDRRVDRGGGLLLVLGDVEGGGLDAVVAVLNEGVGAVN
jgi:hypothetical protein